MGNQIIYSLTIEDIQSIARQELNRYLLPEEINEVINYIRARIYNG